MNPLFDDYEKSVLNINSRITYNPINFNKYNNNSNVVLPPPVPMPDKNIHTFNPIVRETITINRQFTTSGISDIPVDFVQEEGIKNNIVEEVFVEPPAIEIIEEPSPVTTPKSNTATPTRVKYKYSSKNAKQIIKEKGLKPILINKLDSMKRDSDRRLLIDQRCKTNDSLVVKKGQFLSFPISNKSKEPMYIHSIDLHVSVTNSNIRGTLYYTKNNPAKRKYVIDKTKWDSVRHSIRFFSYNAGVLSKSGGIIHIELKELEIEGEADYFYIEIDNDGERGDVTFFLGPKKDKIGNTLCYNGKVWKAPGRKSIYFGIWGRQWQKKEVEKVKKIENDTSEYVSNTWTISVRESRYYYFLVRTLYTCNLEINGREIIKSNRCKKGSKGSCKLEVGNKYKLTLVFSKDDPENYFGWTKKYNKDWIDDITDRSVIKFK